MRGVFDVVGARAGARTWTLVVVPCLAVAALATATAAPAAAAGVHSRALHFTASPSVLSPSGGELRLRASVSAMGACRFSSSRRVRGLPTTKGCASGVVVVMVRVPANRTARARSFVLRLRAGGAGTLAARVLERGMPAVAPVITAQPSSQSVFGGTGVTLTARASGKPRPRVQWQLSADGGARWANVAGATSPTWTFDAPAVVSGYGYREYRAVFRNAAGSATTSSSTLTISAGTAGVIPTKAASGGGSPPASGTAPTITEEPESESVPFGSYLTLSAAASGSPAPAVQWQVSSNGGGSWSDTTSSFVAAGNDSGNEYRAQFTNAAGIATTSVATLTVTAASTPNWSGYVATGGGFTAVSGTWSVPSLTCPAGVQSESAEWVGIDGYSDSTVEQDGTAAYCESGSPVYAAWFEMYGDQNVNNGDAVELNPSNYPVAAGDSLTASTSLSGTSWVFTMTDATRNWNFSEDVPGSTPPPAQSSAEWIVEDPNGCTPQCQTLADFAPVTFTNATATANGQSGPISSFLSGPLQIVGGSTVFAAPGALSQAGNAFTDTWYAN
jgi:Peptidase A4 family